MCAGLVTDATSTVLLQNSVAASSHPLLDMENSSSTHAAWLSLAVAAMVGASVAAASSYMLHLRTVERLQSQRMLDVGDQRKRRVGPGRRRINRDPLAVPDPVANENVKSVLNSSLPPRSPKAPSSDSISTVPPGLPRVQNRKEGTCLQISQIPMRSFFEGRFLH